ncbi:MAG: FkbM family methyltransferase [Thermoplasmatales archaeon]
MYSISMLGLKVRYNHPLDIAAIIENYVLDVYRSRLINKGDTVLDLGAGIGEFSLIASTKVGSRGTFIAIEPSPDDYETLLTNLKENQCHNVIPVNVAVTDFKGELELEFKGKTFKSMCEPLRDILNERNVCKINFCKMDIEGGEKEVIPANTNIFRGIRFLSMEIHNGYHVELIPIMERLGFRFERITKRSYIQNALKFTFRHPLKAYTLLHILKLAGENPGFRKITKRIEIENSNNIVVGTFINRVTSN